jgi:hypothetical protein
MKSSAENASGEQRGGISDIAIRKCSSEKMQLKDLVPYLEGELHYDKDRITAKLIDMKTENKINLVEEPPYSKLFSYAISPSSYWYWGAVAATLLSLMLISITSGLALYLRYVFGGLLVLYLPGFSLIELLYAKRKELDDLTRLALSIGLSLAIVPLDGLVLNYTPFGIRLLPVAISLAAITLVLLTLSLRRKHSYYKLARDVM